MNASPEADFLIPSLAPLYDRMTPISCSPLRNAFGLTILTHGSPKILNTPHGAMGDPMAGTTQLFGTALHLPLAPQPAFFIALLDTFGAAAVAIGAATRLFTPMLAVQMAFICFAIGPASPRINRGIEFPVILGFVALLISFLGGGRWSVDTWIGKTL